MKVFVTGATGLVGSFVTRDLISQKHSPTLLIRKGSDTSLIMNELLHCEIVEGDILDELLLENHFLTCEIVIHCAGLVSYNPSRKKEIFDVNVQGTTNVVNACLNSKVKKLIHVSSIAALGRNELSDTYNEESKWEDSDFNSSYSKSKYLAELEVFRAGVEGLDFSIVNPSVIIGPGDTTRSSTRLLDFVRKHPYFYPDGYLNVIDVRDVSRVICAMMGTSHQNRIVLNTESISYKQLFDIASEIYKRTSPKWKVPFSLIRLAAFFDKIRKVFASGEPFITEENLKFLGSTFSYTSLFYDSLFQEKLIPASQSIKEAIIALELKNQARL